MKSNREETDKSKERFRRAFAGQPQPEPIMIVGYGNGLRGDDGVGFLLAEEIAAWDHPDLRVLAVPQLYPELASNIQGARRVLFLDAREAREGARVEARRLQAREESLPLGHALSPEGVIGLAQDLYGAEIEAWVVTIPAFEFGWREELSPRTAAFLPDARNTISRLLAPDPCRSVASDLVR